MQPILASRRNAYAGGSIDRASERREDEAWVAARLHDPASLFLPVWRGKSLLGIAGDGRPQLASLPRPAAAPLIGDVTWVLLGLREGRAVFALDLGAAEDPTSLLPTGSGRFEELRRLSGLLPDDDAALLAHARGMIHWRRQHRFCGVCGAACRPQGAGNVLVCSGCGARHFPRTDPAVIMLVTRGDLALLAHSQRFPDAKLYSTLAGFVEPGESLEDAVAREVREESGIRIGRVHYHSSQPWPFPASIMLGFYAEAVSTEITIDPEEIRDARWFTRAELRDPAAHGFELSRADSIARRLIDDWINA